jgi:3-oxoacyl-[acyl-carrier-protein] synthase-3
MATAAASTALVAFGLDPAEMAMVAVATCPAIDRSPSVAAQVAARPGTPSPVCFDLNNACAGFCTALACADHTIRAGAARNALGIGAEKRSDLVDWTDRSTCILLGDAAGAAVISQTEGAAAGIGPVAWGQISSGETRYGW